MGLYKDALNEIARTGTMLHELTEAESKQLKETLLEIYDDVKKVCDKYDIKPLLIAGSALGAVRHKGFIPWDDDLDLAMIREEYDRFLEVFEKELGYKYDVMSTGYSDYIDNRFTQIYKRGTVYKTVGATKDKIEGIYVDLFPIDYVPNNKLQRVVKGIYCNFLMGAAAQATFYQLCNKEQKEYMCTTVKGKVLYHLKYFLGFCVSFFSHEKWFQILDKHIRYNKKTDICGTLVNFKHYFGEQKKYDTFFPLSIGSFEGRDVFLPNKTDQYLKDMYGDYMVYPPVEKRERHFMVSIKF